MLRWLKDIITETYQNFSVLDYRLLIYFLTFIFIDFGIKK